MSSIETDGIRIPITLVVEMTGGQVRSYAEEYGLPRKGGSLTAKEIVDDVRSYVLTRVQESPAFGESYGGGARGADVSIKR
jgi:hypothetical protein